jgi:hypothetical protein
MAARNSCKIQVFISERSCDFRAAGERPVVGWVGYFLAFGFGFFFFRQVLSFLEKAQSLGL